LLANLNVPTNRDLQQLQSQVDELNRRVAELLAAEQTSSGQAGTTESAQGANQPGAHENG
jgi:hypothetical protein